MKHAQLMQAEQDEILRVLVDAWKKDPSHGRRPFTADVIPIPGNTGERLNHPNLPGGGIQIDWSHVEALQDRQLVTIKRSGGTFYRTIEITPRGYDYVMSLPPDKSQTTPRPVTPQTTSGPPPPGGPVKQRIFIGHGRSKLYLELEQFLARQLGLDTLYWELEPRASRAVTDILNDFLNRATYAVLLLTAEDETKEDRTRARQNVIHEVGLFQGRLGFNKVALLVQDEVEPLSNLAGLQVIKFNGDNIREAFLDLWQVLGREGIVQGPKPL